MLKKGMCLVRNRKSLKQIVMVVSDEIECEQAVGGAYVTVLFGDGGEMDVAVGVIGPNQEWAPTSQPG